MSKVLNNIRKFYELIYYQIVNKVYAIFHRHPKVRWMTWEITDACNSRCELCNIWKEKPSQDMLTDQEIKRIFSDPLLRDLEMIILTGGEPILRRDLLDIMLFIHSKIPKARFTLSTNALLPDKVLNTVRSALEKGVGIDVGISMDGVGEHHDRIRGVKGNYEKVDYLVNKLLELKPKYRDKLGIIIGQTLHPLTLDYVEEVKKYAQEKGVIYLAQLYDEAPFYHNIGKSKIEDPIITKMIELIKKMNPSFHNEVLLKILRDKTIKFDCYSMRSFFVLRCNGDVLPCLKKYDVKVGNLKDASPSELWGSRRAEVVRKDIIAKCEGCSNTWATDWSAKSEFISFYRLLFTALRKIVFR